MSLGQEDGIFLRPARKRRISPIFAFTVFRIFVLIAFISVLSPGDSLALWPFGKKEPYVAKVGDRVITVKEFMEGVNKLHTGRRVGEVLSREKSFEKQRYRKFLDEMIDAKLMLIEAESMGLDKEADYVSAVENFSLNLFLSRLREDEVVNKVKVEDSEVEAVYAEELKKKEEQKPVKEKKEDVLPADEAHGQVKDKSQREKEVIKNRILNEKIKAREAAYFAYLRGRADVKFLDEAMKKVSSLGPEELDTPLAYVDGEPIPAGTISESARKSGEDKNIKSDVESAVLYKLLDREAAKHGYKNEENIAKAITQFREKRLLEDFKRKAVSAAVKIDEDEISDYYAKNTAKYMMQDLFNLGLITVPSEAEADSVITEIKKGASFARLAEKKSGDSSSVKGGDIGWVSAERFTGDILSAFRAAKEGEVLGPFDASEGKGYVFAVFEFRGMKKGEVMPFEQVKQSVKTDLGRGKYAELFATYLKRLRENIPIEINEEEMAKF